MLVALWLCWSVCSYLSVCLYACLPACPPVCQNCGHFTFLRICNKHFSDVDSTQQLISISKVTFTLASSKTSQEHFLYGLRYTSLWIPHNLSDQISGTKVIIISNFGCIRVFCNNYCRNVGESRSLNKVTKILSDPSYKIINIYTMERQIYP